MKKEIINKYDIESLILIFEKHAKSAEESRFQDLKRFPDAEHLKCDFSISKALCEICREINFLKYKIQNL